MVTVAQPVEDDEPTQGAKTLEATFVTPTAHKDEKLRALYDEYHIGLHDSFDANCETMGAVSDIVTPLNLPYQVKAALCNYVPQLVDDETYGANSLADEHPIRFTNQAATFDYSTEREHGFTWRVPQPGKPSTNFWMPLRINPAQRDHWDDLLDEESALSAGEIRLTPTRTSWTLHVTVKYPTEDVTKLPEDPTYVGLDIGETALITSCALKDGTPTRPIVHSGRRAKHLRKEMYTTLQRLQQRDAGWRINERFDRFSNQLDDIIEQDTTETIEYALDFANPVLVMEDLSYIRESLDFGKFMNRRLHAWAFALLQTRIEQKAKDAGIPVMHVNAAYTSQTCHACNRLGHRRSQAEFVCPHDDCHISVFHADISAAAKIARKANSWGESVPWKPGRDDSPRDGSPSDGATRRTRESATNELATQTPVTDGGVDNAMSSGTDTAGVERMTSDEPATVETVSKPHSDPPS
jgi:IS605 OrfB family transposase